MCFVVGKARIALWLFWIIIASSDELIVNHASMIWYNSHYNPGADNFSQMGSPIKKHKLASGLQCQMWGDYLN